MTTFNRNLRRGPHSRSEYAQIRAQLAEGVERIYTHGPTQAPRGVALRSCPRCHTGAMDLTTPDEPVCISCAYVDYHPMPQAQAIASARRPWHNGVKRSL